MPAPTTPPYSPGGLSIPRTLNRWLDINPQNGSLSRTHSYITLPAFSEDVSWLGYSDIVASFNFEGPNNFSLKSFNTISNPNYLLCISWQDNNGNVYRYKLWSDVGEVLYFNVPLYTGQLIKKNFRFEVWSTNATPVVQTTALTFYTSVLGNTDYRYGTDFTLVSADTIVTNFNNINTALPLNQTSIQNRWVSTSGVTGSPDINSWTDTVRGDILLPTGTVEVDSAFKTDIGVFPLDPGSSLSCNGLFGSIGLLFLVVNLPIDASSGTLLDNGNGYTVSFDQPTSKITIGTAVISIVLGNDTIIAADSFNSRLQAFDLVTGVVSTSTGNIGADETISLNVGNLHSGFAEILLYTLEDEDLTVYNEIIGYLINTYADGISVPITFPSNAVSQPN